MSLNRYSGDDVKLKEYIDTIDYSIVKGGKCLELCQRIVDIVLSLLAMIVGIPVILIAGIFIKIEDNGPILYKQERLGKYGKEFYVYKLRSMRTDAEKYGAQWAEKDDPRVTKVGKFIRKTRIDEIPQLFNIFKGDMGIIGPRPERPGFTKELSQEELLSQASWIDFADVANWSGTTTTSTGQLALQEGSTYTKEISPGYVVTVRVKSLKPFNATEIYKKRLEAQGATVAEKNTYDPNAKNGYMNSAESADGKREFGAGKEALIVGEPQDAWSEIYNSGIDTGEKRTTITTQYEGGNVGVQFEITGTYKGKTVKPTVLMTEGDSSNLGELSLYTTNGTGWQHFAEWYKYDSPYTLNYFPQDTKDLFDPNKKVIGFRPLPINGVNYHSGELAAIREATQVGPDKKPVAWKYYGSPDQKTGGLGTGVFGPNLSAGMVAVPIVMTQGATEVSLYMASASKQSAMIGFLPFDESDAPESYGKATHSTNQVHNVTGEDVKQPYLGDTRPDVDDNVDRTNWKGDDAEGSADEGIDQILPADLKGKTNGILVLDRTSTGDLTMSVEAHTGGADEATLYGWVDFNGNGTFDEDERSEKLTITADGKATLVFKDAFKKVNASLSELGARVRIAKDATQIEKPTGMALSGEVEDFEVHLTFLPKGSKTEIDGLQGIPQTGTVVFTPSGKQRYSLTDNAVIDETIEPIIVDETGAKGTLDAEGYYVVAGEGKYKVAGAGKDVTVEFIPEAGFVGTGKGITIRRTDDNGNDTGWTPVSANEKIVSDQTNTMDGRYIPTVVPMSKELTSTKVQGLVHVETPKFEGKDGAVTPSSEKPMVLVDPKTGKVLGASAPAMKDGKEVGTYMVDETTGKVTFTPNKDFTGTAEPIVVQLNEKATGKAIAGLKYTPTVTPVTPTGEDVTSTGKQGKVQTGTPKFTEGDSEVPLKVDADQPAKFVVNGTVVEETTIDATKDGAKVGTYAIDPLTGEVTFTPNKDFVGTPDAVTVQVKDENGTVATAKYTPTVTAVTPTGEDVTSTGKQGKVQTGTPKFTEGDAEVPLKVDADQPAKFVVNGTAVEDPTIDATKEGTKVGTYTINPLSGEVTFTPNKDFVGTPDAVTVQVKDENGTSVTAKYTPTVTAVTPTGEEATSTGKQGKVQTGTPKFTEGDAEVPLKVDADQPAKFVVNGNVVEETTIDATKEGAKVGTYTIDPLTGEVTFTPNKDFVGTPDAVTVQVKDENGTTVTAKYTPTVTAVTPTGEDVTSTDVQGKTQTGKPIFTEGDAEVPLDDSIPATFEDGTTEKVIAGVGTFTVAADGTITFVPEASFTGEAPAVTVQRVDMNGTVAKASYTATVTPAPVDPVKPEEPTKPGNPAQPEEPTKPAEPAKPVVTEPEAHKQMVVAPAIEKTTQTELPNTGTTDEFAIFNAAALSILASLGLVAASRKKEEQEA